MVSEDDSALGIVLPSMDPSVGGEMNWTFTETMDHDLEQVKLLAMEIGDEDSSWTTKVLRDRQISCILSYVGAL